MGLD
jgi:alkylation response protein AidB-like acyl-CoA dehydrogenase